MLSPWTLAFLLGSNIALGNTDCPNIITKEEWGGRPPAGPPEQLNSPVPFTVVHHGGIKEYCTTQEECSSVVRSYQNYHMDTHGWNDIGYSFIVGEDGNVYEGRGWDTVGAHAPTYNSKSIGICVIGDFTERLPNEAALNAVQDLIQCGVDNEKVEDSYQLMGHRQNNASQTVCPGDALYDELKNWLHWTPNP